MFESAPIFIAKLPMTSCLKLLVCLVRTPGLSLGLRVGVVMIIMMLVPPPPQSVPGPA